MARRSTTAHPQSSMIPLHLVLLACSLAPLTFGQPAGAPKLGADAPTMGYKEVPEWPAQVLNAAGTPGGPWNFIRYRAWRLTPRATSSCCIAAPTRLWNSKATGSSCVPGAMAYSVRARSARSLQLTACPGTRITRPSMDRRDAIPAARIPFAWTRNTTSGLSTLPVIRSTK